MPIDLSRPLAWTTADSEETALLKNLQGNILKGHGRDNTKNIFFRFGEDVQRSKDLLRNIDHIWVTDALTQLTETETFKQSKGTIPGNTFGALFLSAAGYSALQLAFPDLEKNSVFNPGMKVQTDQNDLSDPPPSIWEPPFQERIDGMLLIADDDLQRGNLALEEALSALSAAGAFILWIQEGKALRDKNTNEGLEHFGYVDGRSQPQLLVESVEPGKWDSSFPLDTALVRDPFAEDETAFGSFFIFRKLEQDVAGFKFREQLLAEDLGFIGAGQRELAGALVVGRFEDGTPVVEFDAAQASVPVSNDFDYLSDAGASRCPFHAHIRKTNPRGSGPGGLADERTRIMPRRGLTYEDVPRAVHPSDLPEADTLEEFKTDVMPLLPSSGLGLLFMAYNSRLDDQFAFTQRIWANNLNFPEPASGIDGVIGQGANIPDGQLYPVTWGDPASEVKPFDFKGFVKMLGGEYFFAPSKAFFASL